MSRLLPMCALAVLLAGCGVDMPRDPDRTTARMRGGVMQVGASHDPPNVVVPVVGAPTGGDVELIETFAAAQGARVQWVRGDHDGLMRDLEARRLQAVIGGVHADSPWIPHVGVTLQFDAFDVHGRRIKRVIATPPGENAWLMRMDAHLQGARR